MKDSEISHITAHNNFIYKKNNQMRLQNTITRVELDLVQKCSKEYPKMKEHFHDSINTDYVLSSRQSK